MKLKYFIAGLIIVIGQYSYGQNMTTKEAKVVAVVDSENKTIRSLELFTDTETEGERLQQKYLNGNFYIGLMEGSYEVIQAKVYPQKGTTVIIFNNQPIFGDTDMVLMEHYSPGDPIKIGNIETIVISNNKGELVLKTQ